MNTLEIPKAVLTPIINSENWLLNKTPQELEKLAIKEADMISPKYKRGKTIKRKGYQNYKFLTDFTIQQIGRTLLYKLEFTTIKLPILVDENGKRIKTRVEEELLREEKILLTLLLTIYSLLPGKLNQKLWIPEEQEKHEYKYFILDGKYVKLKDKKAVLLIAIGVEENGNWGIADAILADSESTQAYWNLLVRLWIKFNIQFVVADLHKSIDNAIFRSGIRVLRQPCLVHLKRNMSEEERKELDELISTRVVDTRFKEELVSQGVLNFTHLPQRLQGLLRSSNLVESFNSLLERRLFGRFHSPHRLFQILWGIGFWFRGKINFSHSSIFITVIDIILISNILFHLFLHYIIITERDKYNSQWNPELP
ncbi:transposase [Sulfolobus tengchongensis]|uniref:Transposase n=1 Tax=Sulfolobus tengchongensis TaxID=207809 RepID=A0AAX4KWR0_9CREN